VCVFACVRVRICVCTWVWVWVWVSLYMCERENVFVGLTSSALYVGGYMIRPASQRVLRNLSQSFCPSQATQHHLHVA
jgi:hypothetical protein